MTMITNRLAQRLLQPLIIAALAAVISGCGFHLKSAESIAPSLKVMRLNSLDKYSELASLLKAQLLLNDIRLVDSAEDTKSALLTLYKDKLDRRTLSVFPNGQVAEYELIYSVKYSVTLPNKAAKPFNFEIYRDYQDDPQSALAKSKELKLILKEMRQQAADKIIRQLATLDTKR